MHCRRNTKYTWLWGPIWEYMNYSRFHWFLGQWYLALHLHLFHIKPFFIWSILLFHQQRLIHILSNRFVAGLCQFSFISLFICLSICLTVCTFIFLFFHLSMHRSVYVFKVVVIGFKTFKKNSYFSRKVLWWLLCAINFYCTLNYFTKVFTLYLLLFEKHFLKNLPRKYAKAYPNTKNVHHAICKIAVFHCAICWLGFSYREICKIGVCYHANCKM